MEALYDLQLREEVHRYLYGDPLDMEQTAARLERLSGNTDVGERGDTLSVAVVLKASGTLVGDLTLHLVSEVHKQGEIGFIIHPDHQGNGYATEAACYLLDVAFRQLSLHRVAGLLEARNKGSARVLEKLGMRLEGHLVENEFVKGEWQSELIYAILEREWREGQRLMRRHAPGATAP